MDNALTIKSVPTPRQADPPSAPGFGAIFSCLGSGKIGLRLQSRRAAYAIVRFLLQRRASK